MSTAIRPESPPSDSEVLSLLGQAEQIYQAEQSQWLATLAGLESSLYEAENSNRELSALAQELEARAVELGATVTRLDGEVGQLKENVLELEAEKQSLRQQVGQLQQDGVRQQNELQSLQSSLNAAQQRAEDNQRRANQLAEAVKELHGALFHGNVHDMILRACVTISGASRGLYVSWRGDETAPRVQAALGVDGYPESPPSDFIVELCKRVVMEQDTLVCNDPAAFEGLPSPRPEESFRNCAVAPAILMRGFDGIVLVADKAGEFDEADLEALLTVGNQATVALENEKLHRELQNAYVSTIAVLADAVEAKDPYTHGHCEEASRLARLTAERLDLADHEKSVICYAALLHDVGKIGVSDGVLHKPGPLLPEERELVRAHVRVGHDLIRHVPALASVADAVLHHHEWFNGEGYPDGLRGEQIPVASRVIAVVDAYGAMTTKRSYKEAFTEEHAREELARFAGTQFDPRIVEAFLSMLDTEEYQLVPECGPLPDLVLARIA